jgi:outer membrane receptor protein involved in Fe transport
MRSKLHSRPVRRLLACALISGCAFLAGAPFATVQGLPVAAPTPSKPPPQAPTSARLSEVVVTASRLDLLGEALTASQGSITKKEIELRPIYRIGQLYETVPGLVVTVHSGEGKANQYLLRGFNLDHGTDFASFVDDMPVNRPTNAHGQGYSDQNFLMPEIVQGLDFTKGPFYAAIGDFGAVGSAHVRLTDDLANQIEASAGTLGDDNLFAGGTYHIGDKDRVWAAFDVGHVDGPWDPPSNFAKYLFTGRFSHGSDADGYSLTAMYYNSHGRLETDQSIYAIQEGLISRLGTLDPSDESRSERYSLSGHYGARGDDWTVSANVYAIHATMTLWNDFTHYLFDPINGDQEQQDETRNTFGTDLAFTWRGQFGSIGSDTTVGLQDRYDDVYLDRRHTRDRVVLDYCELANVAGTAATPYAAVDGACSADRVGLNDLGVYMQNTTRWTSWLRSVLGLREEDYQATDHSLTEDVRDSGSQTLFQPKGSLIFGPWAKTEFYLSAGRGFHSNDARGVFETVPLEGIQNLAIKTPLMSPATSEEAGLRTNIIPKVHVQAAVFQEDFSSELIYDQDQGEDQASAPSRRQGVEVSAEYRPFAWIELNSDLAFSKARYTASAPELAAFGLPGPFIANAPAFIGSFGVLVDDLGPWFGGLQWRDLGPYPVNDGAEYPEAKGYSEVNLNAGYKLTSHLRLQASIFNLLNSKADAAAYYYTSRLVPNGPEVAGLQVHPLEPLSGRFTATYTF